MENALIIERPFWLQRIRQAWARRPLVWLSGVRRVGKTVLGRMLPDSTHLNCDLPSVRRDLEDPELHLRNYAPGATLVLDEVHRLGDPSLVLKIAADEFPQLHVLATGSSTLAATRKFSDSLTGRKYSVHLCPVLWEECEQPFGLRSLDQRLLRGGLPELALAATADPTFYSEWIDSFYARDIVELFGPRNRRGFLAVFHLLLRQSGGQVDISKLASLSELSRPTVRAHIEALQIAHALHLLRPFAGGGRREIVSRPKCYAFDTGFAAFAKGWTSIRDDDRGLLWEHLVLDTLRTRFHGSSLFYWRDKARREIDFVIPRSRERVDAVECKTNPDAADGSAIKVFREAYPEGQNHVVCPGVDRPYRMRRLGQVLTVCSPQHVGNRALESRSTLGK